MFKKIKTKKNSILKYKMLLLKINTLSVKKIYTDQ